LPIRSSNSRTTARNSSSSAAVRISKSMIPKSGNRLSEMDHDPAQDLDQDPIQFDRIMV
jgi:hypothetical protein